MSLRLIGEGGASAALIPVPDLRSDDRDWDLSVDVELLTPDRRVTYLNRPCDVDFLASLADWLTSAASEQFPEESVGAVSSDLTGVTFDISESTPVTASVTVSVLDSDDDADGPDMIDFVVFRSSLVTASLALRDWITPDDEET